MSSPPLIAGAGPVGLAAALFLADRGIPTRLLELRAEPATNSKALAVNPRSLEILEPSGVTARMLEIGLPVTGACLHRGDRILAEPHFEDLHPKYPFLLALSQAATERILAEALQARGGKIERETELTACRDWPDGAEATYQSPHGVETVNAPWLLATDGAHSTVRRQMNIPFPGSAFEHDWHLVDAPLRTPLRQDRAHVYFPKCGGFLFLLRVVDPALPNSENLWRVLGDHPDPLSQLQDAEQIGPVVWSSSFRVVHRLNERLSTGHIYFAGDAAHLHSPMGARGMNLGIEDAWVFAQLAAQNRLAEYHAQRHPIDAKVVQRVQFLSRMAATDSALVALVRRLVLPVLFGFRPIRQRVFQTLTGLDHPLPA